MTNIEELKELFEGALPNNSDILLDPFDIAFLMRLLNKKWVLKLYNSLAVLSEDEIEDMKEELDVKPGDILVLFDRELFQEVLDTLNRFAGK
jgi:ferredoxin-fold anticodon binding domain-containing protein